MSNLILSYENALQLAEPESEESLREALTELRQVKTIIESALGASVRKTGGSASKSKHISLSIQVPAELDLPDYLLRSSDSRYFIDTATLIEMGGEIIEVTNRSLTITYKRDAHDSSTRYVMEFDKETGTLTQVWSVPAYISAKSSPPDQVGIEQVMGPVDYAALLVAAPWAIRYLAVGIRAPSVVALAANPYSFVLTSPSMWIGAGAQAVTDIAATTKVDSTHGITPGDVDMTNVVVAATVGALGGNWLQSIAYGGLGALTADTVNYSQGQSDRAFNPLNIVFGSTSNLLGNVAKKPLWAGPATVSGGMAGLALSTSTPQSKAAEDTAVSRLRDVIEHQSTPEAPRSPPLTLPEPLGPPGVGGAIALAARDEVYDAQPYRGTNGLSYLPMLDGIVQLHTLNEINRPYGLPLPSPDQIVVRQLGLSREEQVLAMLTGQSVQTPSATAEPQTPLEQLIGGPSSELSLSVPRETEASTQPVNVIQDSNGRVLEVCTQTVTIDGSEVLSCGSDNAVVNVDDIDWSGLR